MKKCVVIYNPNSGKKIKINVQKTFENILFEKNYETTFICTKYHKHASLIIKTLTNDIDLVISVGGDGTFNEVMSGNLKREHPLLLAHIPLGTTNDIGTMWGYGKNIANNLKLLLEGEIKGIDIGLINDNCFVYVAGIGKFLDVPYITPRDLKKKLGHTAYIIEGIKTFFRKTPLYDITYKIDNKTYSGKYSFVIISNANRIAGINKFYRDIKLNDNNFEILFCTISKKIELIKSMFLLATGNITKAPGLYLHKTSHLKIKFNKVPKKKWCIDGEKMTTNKKEYEIKIKSNVQILMPSKNIKDLFI